jgi:hypothetical protein
VASIGSDDLRTLFVSNTLQVLQINTQPSANVQLNIKFPNLYLRAVPQSDDQHEQVWELSAEETDVMKGAGLEPVQIVAVNSQASYLVGA